MPSIAGLVTPAAAVNGVRNSLALARGANPRASNAAGSFDQHLDLAVRSGIGGGSEKHGPATGANESSNLLHSAPGNVVALDGGNSIEALRADYRTASADFEQRLRQLLREHNIELGDGIVLEANANGEVQVVGEHPQKQAIERLFRDDSELRSLFMGLGRQASMLRAADLSADLARLHDEAPSDAIQQVQQLLGGASAGKFSLAVRNDAMVAQFS